MSDPPFGRANSAARTPIMTHVTKFAAAAIVVHVALSAAVAQNLATNEERNSKLSEYSSGQKAVDADGRKLFERVANYYAAQLTDANVQRDRLSSVIGDLERKFNRPSIPEEFFRVNGNRRTFNEEFGKALAVAVEPVLLENTKPIARINAARMLANGPCKAGADAVAETLLKCLANPQESDAVRYWALKGLGNLLVLVPEQQFPARTVFQKEAVLELPVLEQRVVLALVAFIERKNELKDDMLEEEKYAFNYVRREAIQALGHVRVQTVKDQGVVKARPALTLLRAARRELPAPAVSIGEQLDAIIGFCQLLPDRDRDLQLDYAVPHIAEACADAGQFYIATKGGMDVPWKVTAVRIRDSVDQWYRINEEQKIAGAIRIRQLGDNLQQNLLLPLEQAAAAVAPNLPAIRAFAARIRADAPTVSLFKSDPTTVVTPVPWK